MGSDTSIRFQFHSMTDAEKAFDTLAELGYRPVYDVDTAQPGIYIYPHRQDLTSALEIAHIFGGVLSGESEFGVVTTLEDAPYASAAAQLHPPYMDIDAGSRDPYLS